MESLTFWIAIPDSRLNPNNIRGNSRRAAIARSDAKKKLRSSTEMIVLSEMRQVSVRGNWKAGIVEVTWYAKTARKLDRDNARSMLKGMLDGCTRAGLWGDDNDVDIVKVTRLKDAAFPRVEMTCRQTA